MFNVNKLEEDTIARFSDVNGKLSALNNEREAVKAVIDDLHDRFKIVELFLDNIFVDMTTGVSKFSEFKSTIRKFEIELFAFMSVYHYKHTYVVMAHSFDEAESKALARFRKQYPDFNPNEIKFQSLRILK